MLSSTTPSSSDPRGIAGIRYTASDCFETFPFPPARTLSSNGELEQIGEKLDKARAWYMKKTKQGLTKTYNKLKDPDCNEPEIISLRELHIAMDRAVLDAYGWSTIKVPPYTTPKTQEQREALSKFEDEVTDRLFVLNAERAKEERNS